MTSNLLNTTSASKWYSMRSLVSSAIVVLLCSVIAWVLTHDAQNGDDGDDDTSQMKNNNEPLYWVAPMDDNYRRDKPGKSPMGMDLVPVYAERDTDFSTVSSTTHSSGTVMIAPNVQQNMGVKTAPVDVGKLDLFVNSVATVTYNEDEIYHIHPRVEGWIDTLFIKSQGERVEAGQPLYTLYSPELVSAQEEYLLALKRNNSRLEDGAIQRLKSLALYNNFIDDLRRTKKVSQQVTFTAPQSGVVEAMTIRGGFYVEPGTTIMSIANVERVWVIADIPEKYAGNVKVGDKAVVTQGSHPTSSWKGTVDYIYPSLTMASRTLKVRIPLANKNGALKPNMLANVSLYSQQLSPSLRVPKSAVIRTQSSTRVVLTDKEGQFKSVNIATGRQDAHFYEVTHGLLPGDDVVVSAQFLIDAESSKASDFKRMEAPAHQASTWGVIEDITTNQTGSNGLSSMTIARGPIEKWRRGPATMDFVLSPHINASSFSVGDKVVFTFVADDEFTIVDMRRGPHSNHISTQVEPDLPHANDTANHNMDRYHD